MIIRSYGADQVQKSIALIIDKKWIFNNKYIKGIYEKRTGIISTASHR